MKSSNHVLFHVLTLAFVVTSSAQDNALVSAKALPFVRDFEPARYLGKWYEVARLPTEIQPAETLAVAEYSAGNQDGQVLVKNSAFDTTGKKLSAIQGQARMADGEPPGRLLVAFGPAFPETPNYHILHVDEDYRYAVVGVPNRQSLWILAREVPISKEALDSLREIARGSGFDVSKLIVAPWEKVPKTHEAESGSATNGSQPIRSETN